MSDNSELNIIINGKSDPANVLRFSFSLAYTKTMADGSPRIVLDLPESAMDVMNTLAKMKLGGAIFEAAVVPVIGQTKATNGRGKPRNTDKSAAGGDTETAY